MVALELVRESNARLRELGPGLVALFVGSTSGIGEFTAKAFVQSAVKPHVYLVGRNVAAADRIIEECKALNRDGKVEFIKADVSELGEVDRVCKEIQAKEKHINLLFQTQSNFNLRGRDLSSSGLDRKLTLNYYSRIRFIHNLLPLLKNGTANLSRSVSLLGAGGEGKIDIQDLALENNYGSSAVANHTIVMNDLIVDELAARYPHTTFIHTVPGIVDTGLARELPLWARIGLKGVMVLLKPFSVSAEETGQRQLFHATSGLYPPRIATDTNVPATGVSVANDLSIVEGADGKQASGAYLVNWNGDSIRQKDFLIQYRKQGYSKVIWDHTMGAFEKYEKLKSSG